MGFGFVHYGHSYACTQTPGERILWWYEKWVFVWPEDEYGYAGAVQEDHTHQETANLVPNAPYNPNPYPYAYTQQPYTATSNPYYTNPTPGGYGLSAPGVYSSAYVVPAVPPQGANANGPVNPQ